MSPAGETAKDHAAMDRPPIGGVENRHARIVGHHRGGAVDREHVAVELIDADIIRRAALTSKRHRKALSASNSGTTSERKSRHFDGSSAAA
jgi:hypothetical protein